jgi:hypothetical protein
MNYLETTIKIFTTPITFIIDYKWLLEFFFVYGAGLSVIFCLVDSLYLISEKLFEDRPKDQLEDQSVKFLTKDIEQAAFRFIDSYRKILAFDTHSNLIIIARPDDRDRLIKDFYSDFLNAMQNGSAHEIRKVLLELMSSKWFTPVKGDVGYVRLFIPSLFKEYIKLDVAASLLDIIRGYKDDYIKIMKFLESIDDVMMRDFVKSMHLIYINKGLCRSSEFQARAISTIARFLADYLDKTITNDIEKLNADDIINLTKIGSQFSQLCTAASAYIDKNEMMLVPLTLSQIFPDDKVDKAAKLSRNPSFVESIKKMLLDKVNKRRLALQALMINDGYNIVSKVTLPYILVKDWGLSNSWAFVSSSYEHKILNKEVV